VTASASSDVHVWTASLDVSDAHFRRLVAVTSADERSRASRFRIPLHRRRFLTGRGLLRELLGEYVRIHPSKIEFAYGIYGKPILTPEVSAPHFNVAHANDLALYAIAASPVGVDVEAIAELTDARMIAESFFAPDEVRELEGVPEPLFLRSFYACWTRKEAYVKAIGRGMSESLSSFAVSVAPDSPPVLRSILNNPTAPDRWTIAHLEPAFGFVGAVAVEQPHCGVVCRWWQ